jgi:hypothetical protein
MIAPRITRLAACLLLLSSCATEADLTPAERELRATNQRFGLTVAEGAVLAAILGAGLGALASPKDRGRGAAIGGLAGGVAGAGAGYFVARNNAARAGSEADYRQLIVSATQDADAYARSAAASRQIAASARADGAALDAAWRARRITAAAYAEQLQKYESDSEIIRTQIVDADQRAGAMQTDAANVPPQVGERLEATASRIFTSRDELARSAEIISAVTAAQPQSGS